MDRSNDVEKMDTLDSGISDGSPPQMDQDEERRPSSPRSRLRAAIELKSPSRVLTFFSPASSKSTIHERRCPCLEEDPVEKLRIKNPKMLQQLARMHLSRLIEMEGEEFEELLLTADEKASKKAGLKRSKNDPALKFRSTSGEPLTEEGASQCYQLIEFIKLERNIVQEGIFRKSGAKQRSDELEYMLNCAKTVDLAANRFTVHDCCVVLKHFLDLLPEPLFTDRFFKVFTSHMDNKSDPKRLQIIQILLLLIPYINRRFLRDLIDLLAAVHDRRELNKMTAKNLAIIFSPHIFVPRHLNELERQRYVHRVTGLLELMIVNSKTVFDVPAMLLKDVKLTLANGSLDASRETLDSLVSSHSGTGTDDVDGEPEIQTVVTFCERDPDEANSEDTTNKELAKLYAYVQSLPDTPYKKELIKKFNRENGYGTPQVFQSATKSAMKSTPARRLFGNVFKGLFSRNSTAKKGARSQSIEHIASPETPRGPQLVNIKRRSSSASDLHTCSPATKKLFTCIQDNASQTSFSPRLGQFSPRSPVNSPYRRSPLASPLVSPRAVNQSIQAKMTVASGDSPLSLTVSLASPNTQRSVLEPRNRATLALE